MKLKCRVYVVKTGPIATVQVFVWYNPLPRFGSSSNPNLEPFLTVGMTILAGHCTADDRSFLIGVGAKISEVPRRLNVVQLGLWSVVNICSHYLQSIAIIRITLLRLPTFHGLHCSIIATCIGRHILDLPT